MFLEELIIGKNWEISGNLIKIINNGYKLNVILNLRHEVDTQWLHIRINLYCLGVFIQSRGNWMMCGFMILSG